ncbi:hypothetical protein [Jannaschia aquimarina]|uniref:SnoaL-like domain-containing protein n=1 Tax=Jannaschia aquimarina TaxID=935700 RepID=A0A0D1EKM1_9RHOB|nr:hypothetical protein [Jannaschia aquimarina]KIT18144.1 hypothetical protein jaqu_00780 [Jannaschia aquimarina]SNT30391.1 hypothetical protein SAMN05421775_110135 [Jannaschia aquimarina]
MDDAREIFQEHLDRVSQAVWDRDYDAVAAAISYPHRIGMPEGPGYIAPDAEAMKGHAKAFRESLSSMGATAYHRICRDAAFMANDRIEGRHVTYILSGGTYLVDPYPASMTLILKNGVWLSSEVAIGVRYSVLLYGSVLDRGDDSLPREDDKPSPGESS